MEHFPVARYQYSFRLKASLQLPDFAGSLLRGQLGANLRRLVCVTRAPRCDGCGIRSSCAYPTVFETPAPTRHAMQKFSHVPNAYVVEPPAPGRRVIEGGEALHFGLVLIGRALGQLALVTLALQRAFEQGLGSGGARTQGELTSLAWQQPEAGGTRLVEIWSRDDGRITAHDATLPLPAPTPHERLRLDFETPLRLQSQGRPLTVSEMTPRKLIADLLRRITLLNEFHASFPESVVDAASLVRAAAVLEDEKRMRWMDWSRYSSRQNQEMTLGGAVGNWTLRGALGPLLPWLHLGQWLHIGKNATMGLGRYTLHSSP